MGKKRSTQIRVYPETKIKIEKAKRELSAIQNVDISTPEVLRRMANTPGIKDILIKDADYKRRFRKK